ncbi:V-type ATP synthase subunit F [Candidatus Woesearchaeota archaeon]|nr:V-type ATP synthase subunit F [Candidatus Woesearchaeota archaeon]|tara:strand:- start:878 stop:1165 length:288 start_codon:yes stop_codon:yes gene_type:complete
MEIAVIGKEDFCLGFRLAGIKKIFETDKPQEAISKIRQDTEIGIVILDENLFKLLETEEKETLENSLKPIYITLSKEASEDSLKKMIRKSIGVEV